jgi:ectoine hydroxylase-related dioxygenase (phytanoyl-CoA dioxygenase family)
MKAGEVLVFDNRILHHSYQNLSGKARIAVICGLFPEEAKFITCHKPEYRCGEKVELIEHEDSYLLKGKNFLIDCQKRPETGISLGQVDDPYYEISAEEFEALCSRYQLNKSQIKTTQPIDCAMIAEPE